MSVRPTTRGRRLTQTELARLMQIPSSPFLWSDAWLLLSVAIAQSEGGASLDRVVAAGDYINHAIFTFDELDGGVQRLATAGILVVESRQLQLTPLGSAIHAKVAAQRRSVRNIMSALQQSLAEASFSQLPSTASHRPFSQADLAHAYAQYKNSASKPSSRARRRATGKS